MGRGKSAMCVVFVVCLDQWESGFGSGRSLNADKQNFLAAKLLTGWSSYLLPRHPALSVCLCVFVSVSVCVCEQASQAAAKTNINYMPLSNGARPGPQSCL